MIRFRPVSFNSDWALLLAWRNDPLTREMSRNTDIVPLANHLDWLRKHLDQQIAIANNIPVGVIRVDDGELSWTIAPDHRGKGLGSAMLVAFLAQNPGDYRAEIKADNAASIAMADRAGVPYVVI